MLAFVSMGVIVSSGDVGRLVEDETFVAGGTTCEEVPLAADLSKEVKGETIINSFVPDDR